MLARFLCISSAPCVYQPSWTLTNMGFLYAQQSNIYLRTKFDISTFIHDSDMAKSIKPTWRPPPFWILPKLRYGAIITLEWLHTKFYTTTYISVPRCGQKSKSKMVATKIWNFAKSVLFDGLVTPVWTISNCAQNFTQISLLAAGI